MADMPCPQRHKVNHVVSCQPAPIAAEPAPIASIPDTYRCDTNRRPKSPARLFRGNRVRGQEQQRSGGCRNTGPRSPKELYQACSPGRCPGKITCHHDPFMKDDTQRVETANGMNQAIDNGGLGFLGGESSEQP